MKSLLLRNGDLVLGPGGFETVEGAPKVAQDLGIAVREPYGGDRFHPNWGSVLDNFVGGINDSVTPVLIEAEVRRVIQNYVALQQAQVQADATVQRSTRFGANEIITGVRGIGLSQFRDRIAVKVGLQTLGRTQIEVDTGVA